MIHYIDGDLIELAKQGTFDVIVHGCNCQNVMGAGIALQIAQTWPQAVRADVMCNSMLGKYSECVVGNLTIINAYTQMYPGVAQYGVDSNMHRLLAIHKVFSQLDKTLKKDAMIGIPKIGAGLAGGKWETIEKVINCAITKHDIIVVNYKR
jgi:O-acetyl-ADP-ribose deacetylase (regulator of RNase III)